jgi:Ca2+-binding RTX toxin-like protein
MLLAPGTVVHASAHGGAGADRLDTSRAGGELDGDAGDDILIGGDPGDTLRGGMGDDTISGGGARDFLFGGPGADVISAGTGDDFVFGDDRHDPLRPDDMDGGPGEDQVSYTARTEPVDVDLARLDGNGSAGENDKLRGFEEVEGGAGSDRLAGDESANTLTGQGFDTYGPDVVRPTRRQQDTLIGRGGDDYLDGSEGPDLLDGGDGNDSLLGGHGADRYDDGAGDDRIDLSYGSEPAGAIRCGPGDDSVQGLSRQDSVRQSCESIVMKDTVVSTKIARSVLDVAITQLPNGGSVPCRIDVELKGPDRTGAGDLGLLGSGAIRPRARHVRHARIALNARGKRVLAATHPVRLRIRLHDTYRCGTRRAERDSLGGFTLLLPPS